MDRNDIWARRLDPELADEAELAEDVLPPDEEAAIARLADALGDEALWSGPSPSVRDSLLSAVAAERPAAHRSPASRRRSIPRAGWWASAAAAIVLVVGGVVVLRPHSEGPAQQFTAAGTSSAGTVTATVELRPKPGGVAIRLIIKGLHPAPPGSYYAAWVRGPKGIVPVGTFHWHVGGHPIDLWSGVDSIDYPELFVTLQHEGDSPAPSGPTVLDGTLPSS